MFNFNVNDIVTSVYDDKIGIVINVHTELNETQPFYDIEWINGTIRICSALRICSFVIFIINPPKMNVQPVL